jgi:tetracycline 7-halogenase / FADH2 O2-dependent halogenase
MKVDFDVGVIGSGFGGSLIAMIARRLELKVVLVERHRHPRFAIGESSTPLANLLLEEICRRYDLPQLLPLCKWGTWQTAYPQVGCGLKRGFTFYHHRLDQAFVADPERRNELLVAASPHDEIADTHWYRADVDHHLAREAVNAGVELLEECVLGSCTRRDNGFCLTGQVKAKPIQIAVQFLIDATGPRGFLHRTMNLAEDSLFGFPKTQGLYTHLTGVRRLSEMGLSQREEATPFPIDDAAVHHVFDGGWIWVLHFNNGITSAGVAATHDLASELRFEEGPAAWQRLLERLPTVRSQFGDSRAVLPFTHAPRLSFLSSAASGPGWALLPSAAGFIDPLLSTGFPLTLLGIQRLAKALELSWGSQEFQREVASYAARTIGELNFASKIIGALYANLADPEIFSAISLLYFSAASYSETARRLDRSDLAKGFLLREEIMFAEGVERLCQRATLSKAFTPTERVEFLGEIAQTIKPFDVTGLTHSGRRNWHPVDIADLYRAAPKLGATESEIDTLRIKCGL